MDGFSYAGIKTAMVSGAHADDEIIACGGTLHRMSRDSKKSVVVTYTGGGTSAESTSDEAQQEMISKRIEEMGEADRILGVTGRHFLEIPSQELSGAVLIGKETAHEMIKLMRRYGPDVVFAHYQYPDHRDHADHDAIAMRAVHCARLAAENLLQDTLGPPLERMPIILRYGIEETLPESNVLIEISEEDLDAKLRAMDAQGSQTRKGYLDKWKIRIAARANEFGARLPGNRKYAEAFYLDPASPLMLGLD